MKKLVLGSIVVLGGFIGAIGWNSRVTHLDPPLIKATESTVGQRALFSGVAYPNAHLAVYVNDQYTQDLSVSSDGSFEGSLSFLIEGKNELKMKQLYGNISSEFSEVLTLDIDLTPPDKNTFSLTSRIPAFSKELSLPISGRARTEDKVLVNGTHYVVATDGSFSEIITLKNGENILSFSLEDKAGNTVLVETHVVMVDSIPPKVSTSFCDSKGLSALDLKNLAVGEEYVCISNGQWEDWRDPAPIPITGFVEGNIGSITVDGKRVYPDENNEIFQRIYLPVPKGLNKYKVVVTDKYGNQTTTSITMTVESVRSNGYDDVIDRLDDIEGQIDDLDY